MKCKNCYIYIIDMKCKNCNYELKECVDCINNRLKNYYDKFLEVHHGRDLFKEKIDYLKNINYHIENKLNKCFFCSI
jgi:hypothetical protein